MSFLHIFQGVKMTAQLTDPTINATPIELPSQDSYADMRTEFQELFNDIWELSVSCIYISPSYRTTFILWIFLTRSHSFIRHAPILLIDAKTRGCGKTTLQQFITVMCNVSLDSRTVDFTKAGIKRLSDTSLLFLDEVDSVSRSSLKNITNYLNSSFEQKGARSINAYGSTTNYGFRCLSGIQVSSLLEDATLSRSIYLELTQPPSQTKLKSKFDDLPLDHLYLLADEIDNWFVKYSDKLKFYFTYIEYSQQGQMTNRFGDVWRNLFKLGTLLDENHMKKLEACVARQYFLEEPVLFNYGQYYSSVRDFQESVDPDFYDGSEVVETDYTTNDFLTGIHAIFKACESKISTGVTTKELHRLIMILVIKDAPPTQRMLGRYMTSLGFNLDKNIHQTSGFRFDQTFEVLSTKYPNTVDAQLCTTYMDKLQPHI